MKICWDNLEQFHLTRNGFLRKGRHSYVEVDKCKVCGDIYLMLRFQETEYCSPQCAQKYRKTSIITRRRISDALTGHKRTKEECEAISKRMLKGGVVEKNLPLYDTYVHQLKLVEEIRRCPIDTKLLEVKCVYCAEWFIPKRTVCDQRCQFIKGNVNRENLFYCSEGCKGLCPVFHKRKYSVGHNPRKHRNHKQFTEHELNIWRGEVLKKSNYKCEYCGEKATIAHHIQPKKLEPFFALDLDNGIACCEDCHYTYGHEDSECNTGYLASINCI